MIEGAENMLVDFAVFWMFDDLDLNDNGTIEESDVDAVAAVLELDDAATQELHEGLMIMDADEDGEVSWEEWENVIQWSLEQDDSQLKWELLEDVEGWIDEDDIDCSADGVEGCEDERETRRADIEEWAAEEWAEEE